MPIYEYECVDRHRTERFFRRHTDAPEETPCEAVTCLDHGCDCGKPALRVISQLARFDVKRDWNDNASDMQRDPYTQSKAQLTNMNREAAEFGGEQVKITEETIQAGARAIHEQKMNPKPNPEQRQIARMRRKSRKARAAKESG